MRVFDSYVPGNRKVNTALLWDYNTENFNPEEWKSLLTQRTIQLGRLEDFYTLFDIYGGYENVRRIAAEYVTGLDNRDLQFMCNAFNLKMEDTKCYKRKLLREKHFSS